MTISKIIEGFVDRAVLVHDIENFDGPIIELVKEVINKTSIPTYFNTRDMANFARSLHWAYEDKLEKLGMLTETDINDGTDGYSPNTIGKLLASQGDNYGF